jgi:hypothetical protein
MSGPSPTAIRLSEQLTLRTADSFDRISPTMMTVGRKTRQARGMESQVRGGSSRPGFWACARERPADPEDIRVTQSSWGLGRDG